MVMKGSNSSFSCISFKTDSKFSFAKSYLLRKTFFIADSKSGICLRICNSNQINDWYLSVVKEK